MAAPVLDSSVTLVAGNFHAFRAPIGTTLPSGVPTEAGDGLDAAFESLGYTGPDGAAFKVDTQTKELYAHQSYDPLRILVTSRKAAIDLVLLQWDTPSLITALGGGSVEAVTGGGMYSPPEPGTIEEQVIVCDIVDGDDIVRIVAERCFVAGSINAALKKDDWATLPITLTALAPDNANAAWTIAGEDLEPVS